MPDKLIATTLVLVRHGETAWNAEGRVQGHLDIPLSPVGIAQARALGARLAGERFDAIYSSDLARAFETARAVVGDRGPALIRDPLLRERNLGVLQAMTAEDAMHAQPAAWTAFRGRDPHAALSGGESLEEFSRRVIAWVEDIRARHAGLRILAVSHGGVLDAAYRHAVGMPLAAPRDFPIYNASLNTLAYDHDQDGWRIVSWGDVSHLPRELALDDT